VEGSGSGVGHGHKSTPKLLRRADMSELHGMARLVVIGNGAAGTAAVQAYRQHERTGEVFLVSGEAPLFFSRPGLLGVGLGQTAPQDLVPFPKNHFDDAGITCIQSVCIGIDAVAREVHLSSGQVLAYDQLVLAWGLVPRELDVPLETDGTEAVLRLHGWEDGPLLAAQRGSRWGVMGGGWIGAELAEIAAFRGVEVDWWMRGPYPGAPWVAPEEGAALLRRLRGPRFRIHTGFTLEEVRCEAGVWHILGRPADGVPARFAVDAFAAGIGVAPDLTRWRALLGPGFPSDFAGTDGIRVRRDLSTLVPGIWAAGDCVDPAPWGSGPLRNWRTAQRMGQHVGRTLAAGPSTDFDPGIPQVDARIFDRTFVQWGAGFETSVHTAPSVSGWWDPARLQGVRFHWHPEGTLRGVATWDWRLKPAPVLAAIRAGLSPAQVAVEWPRWSHEPPLSQKPWDEATQAILAGQTHSPKA